VTLALANPQWKQQSQEDKSVIQEIAQDVLHTWKDRLGIGEEENHNENAVALLETETTEKGLLGCASQRSFFGLTCLTVFRLLAIVSESIMYVLAYQVFADVVCFRVGGLYRYCPGSTGIHLVRSITCSSHLWFLRRISLPYECLNICCSDRKLDGSATGPTASSFVPSHTSGSGSGEKVDEHKLAEKAISADVISSCDYPGAPPPAWYRSWAAAMRDGVCGLGPPVFAKKAKTPAIVGGVFASDV